MRRTVSLALALLMTPLLCARVAPARAEGGRALRVTGEVLSASVEEEVKNNVTLRLKVRFRFFNAGARPLILLDRRPWLGSKALSPSREGAAAGRHVRVSHHWPSNYRGPGSEWDRLERGLDRREPPAGLTRVLQPGGSWEWVAEDYQWSMSRRTENLNGPGAGWDELREAPQLWLTFTFEMWPINVEPTLRRSGRSEYGLKLRRRWQAFGDLWLENVSTEPMELRLDAATRKPPPAN